MRSKMGLHSVWVMGGYGGFGGAKLVSLKQVMTRSAQRAGRAKAARRATESEIFGDCMMVMITNGKNARLKMNLNALVNPLRIFMAFILHLLLPMFVFNDVVVIQGPIHAQ